MKVVKLLFQLIPVFLIVSCAEENAVVIPPSDVIKDFDGNIYHAVKIGNQVWMLENLKVTHYRNGDPIPNVTENEFWSNLVTGAYCDYNNDTNNSATYGKIYNWYTIEDNRNLAPKGWHVASQAEWTELINFLGGESLTGGKLKETDTTHWKSPNTNASNVTGFTALPGGYRLEGGKFKSIRTMGLWWTLTSFSDPLAHYHYLSYINGTLVSGNYPKEIGMSVRCVKDK
jgi:uncharacterized protein (TIGR02145 family)